MDSETILIETAERLGLGLDLNHLRGTYTVKNGRSSKKFNSILDALDYVKGIDSSIKKVGLA